MYGEWSNEGADSDGMTTYYNVYSHFFTTNESIHNNGMYIEEYYTSGVPDEATHNVLRADEEITVFCYMEYSS